MTTKLRAFVILLSTPIIVFVIVGGYLGKALARDGSYQNLTIFQDALRLVVNNYVEEVDLDKVMEGALRGLTDGADGLDADSAYLTPAQVKAAGHGAPPAGETGIELSKRYFLAIIATRAGSPADRAGLRSGDYIRAIDGRSTRDTSVYEGMRLLRGAPGSTVRLTIVHGVTGESTDVPISRETASWPAVVTRPLADHAGYLKINAFGPSVAAQVRQELAGLTRGGATQFVIDVRGTAAGAPAEAAPVARLFLRDQVITYTEGRTRPRETQRAEARDGDIQAPVAVLINHATAGAAEVFAAALADNGRADLVGEKTFGRAAEQKLVPLPNGSGLWLSYLKYFTPSGKPIHEKGIDPTVVVETGPDGDAAPGRDEVLERALQQLRARLGKAA